MPVHCHIHRRSLYVPCSCESKHQTRQEAFWDLSCPWLSCPMQPCSAAWSSFLPLSVCLMCGCHLRCGQAKSQLSLGDSEMELAHLLRQTAIGATEAFTLRRQTQQWMRLSKQKLAHLQMQETVIRCSLTVLEFGPRNGQLQRCKFDGEGSAS